MSERHDRRNREIGLVRKKQVEERHRSIHKERENVREIDSIFASLKKTLAVAQNQDSEWQAERKEMGKIMNEIIQIRNRQTSMISLLDIPTELKYEYYAHLLGLRQHYASTEIEVDKYYALNLFQ